MENFYAGLADILEIDVARVGPGLNLTELAWDSLAIVATIALVDENFGFTPSGSALAKCQTVADIEALIREKKA